ncbi:melanocortin receptor 4-like protein [Labeo rohita]|uniref:Melanocortin receptor 4-like protein n=1 Tax=Labeo rohita TaxID=84645 RepID=A0A498MN49_LABRO|nr:melanocortin receptor 4-like protein [Labeo rohita]
MNISESSAGLGTVLPLTSFENVLLFLFNIFLATAIIFFNASVFIAILMNRSLRNENRFMYMLSTCLSDIGSGVSYYYNGVMDVRDYYDSPTRTYYIALAFLGLSYMAILAAQSDRYHAVSAPFKYSQRMTRNRTLLVILIYWVYVGPKEDPTIEPAAASRGRRPSRATAAHTSRRRITPSPSRHQPPSPASSYASTLTSVTASSGVIILCRSTKVDLLDLYASFQTNSTPPSRALDKASTGRNAPYSWFEQITQKTVCEPGPNAPNATAASTRPPPRSSEWQFTAHTGGKPAIASTSRGGSASSPPPVASSCSQLLPHHSLNPLPYPWPAARHPILAHVYLR